MAPPDQTRSLAAPILVRRNLYETPKLRLEHIVAQPVFQQSVEDAPLAQALVLPLQGVFTRNAGSRRQLVATANHAVFFPAYQPYRVSFPGGFGGEVMSLQWSPEVLAITMPEAQDCFETTGDRHALLDPRQMVRRNLLWHALSRDHADQLEIEERSMALLASILQIGGPRSPAPGRIERVKEAVALQPARNWTLDELARVASMSQWHLSHVFRREVGTSVHNYVLRLRLALALRAVIEGHEDITTIATAHGFASHSHFTLRFRSLFGLAPSHLRKKATAR
jgi:AraC-like DNA-binding protein